MDNDSTMVALLREIRTGQQEHLALYRDVTRRSLDAQQVAIDLQRRAAKLYRIVVVVAAALVAGLVATLFSLPF
jgi:uncharacterized membrane protein YjjP (DUF1212 family)